MDEKLNRSDIRSDPADGSVRPGRRCGWRCAVSRLTRGTCAPLPGAMVDLWHCDAVGVYSDVQDPGGATLGKKFLRGYQTTDGDGLARFTTIYPGPYRGRAVHIHFKVRSAAGGGRVHDFTSQLFFDDALSDQVYAQPPYAGRGESACATRGTDLSPCGRPAHARGSARRARLRGDDVRARARDRLESRRDALPDRESQPPLHRAARGGRRIRVRPFLRDVRQLPGARQGGGPRRDRPHRVRRRGDRRGGPG